MPERAYIYRSDGAVIRANALHKEKIYVPSLIEAGAEFVDLYDFDYSSDDLCSITIFCKMKDVEHVIIAMRRTKLFLTYYVIDAEGNCS